MSRGFKRDLQATADAYRLGTLVDKKRRSFISLPKFIEGEGEVPHLILYGADKGPIRAAIFKLNRESRGGGNLNRCSKCFRIVSEDSDEPWTQGQWDHIRNKNGERCDCIANSRVLCDTCHRLRHPRTKFGSRRSAEQVGA